MNTANPFLKPVYVMAKPAGARCNLDCKYCYYTEKVALAPDTQPDGQRGDQMSDEMLERFVRQYIEAQPAGIPVQFTWHGGEPLLRSRAFYEKAIALQQQYAGGRQIDNCLQTNGTLLTPDWAQFLHDAGWLVGISIDGPQDLHDRYRLSRGGAPTWAQVMRGVELLNHYNVEWNALAVVTRDTARMARAFYRFFREAGCRYLQFTPVVERLLDHEDGRHLASPRDGVEATLAPWTVRPQEWGDFLCTVFDEWSAKDVGELFVQLFESTLAGHAGVMPGVCTLAPTCGHAAVIEACGDLYSCDHFVFPEYRLGNICDASISEMMRGERQTQFGLNKVRGLTATCRSCQWLRLCHGECPRNRFARSAAGEPGHNYLCAGYRKFFAHSAPFFQDYCRKYL